MKMPGLTKRSCQLTNDNAVCSDDGFWSKQRDEISSSYLQKFWGELSPQARQDLLKLDKKSIFEQARKNMYCSRCNGLLLESFMQIVMFGKSSQADRSGGFLPGRRNGALNSHSGALSNAANTCHDDSQDPAVHPWGGLTTAKDGTLTVLSTYIYSKSLNGLQNVFDSAQARERERELLYPDACGGGGRGWISQGFPNYGRGHGTREACALHTARLSCDTLVDFWSALGEDTRYSLLRMKEEDFIERLMYRFDSKRFCRDCRKNVIREFKELKELKRMRREPHCTHSFCSADSILQYQVYADSIRADWQQTFMDSAGTYHHFEWAVGTGEGKSDILDFENIGMNNFVHVDGLDLGELSACYITLRAWKQDGRCTELSVKAHKLKDQECVHSRLVVGDGFVSMTIGESTRGFFEHAEEVEEEEEDDDGMDKDGNEMEVECSHPQKHAKSPELAREFLLDAATVIFKEQVEKAFREGTARQNAHSVFVCLVVKLLEERVHVACKEIITLEKQMKLLEEEEKEKIEEEERKERRRMKEREKKQRRKERLKEKDGDKDKEVSYSNTGSVEHQDLKDEQSSIEDEENIIANGRESPNGKPTCGLSLPNMQDQIAEISSESYSSSKSRDYYQSVVVDSEEVTSAQDECDYTTLDNSEYSFHGDKYWKDDTSDSVSKCSDGQRSCHVSENGHAFTQSESRVHSNKFEVYSKSAKGLNRQLRVNGAKAQPRNCVMKHDSEKFHSLNSRLREKYDSCSCTNIPDYRVNGVSKVGTAISYSKDGGELKTDSSSVKVKQFHYGTKSYQSDYVQDSSARIHSRNIFGNTRSRDHHTRMVWEPMDSQKKYPRRNSESDIAMVSSSLNMEGPDSAKNQSESVTKCCDETVATLNSETSNVTSCTCDFNTNGRNNNTVGCKMNPGCSRGLLDQEVDTSLKDSSDVAVGSDSNSENSYSNICGGNSNLTSSSSHNLEMTSSDSEDASQLSENKESSPCQSNEFPGCRNEDLEKTPISKPTEGIRSDLPTSFQFESGRFSHLADSPEKSTLNSEHVPSSFQISEPAVGLPVPMPQNQNFSYPIFHQAPSTIGYYHPSTIIWPTAPANSLIVMPTLNPYVVSSPLSYGWNGTPGFCMPYGGVSHMEPPLLSQGQVPIYPPVSKGTGMHPEERVKISKPTLAHSVSLQVHNKPQIVPPCIQSENTQNGSMPPKPDPERAQIRTEKNNGFSLFHFGGPVALSSTLKEGKMDELVLNNSHNTEVDHIYIKKEASIEEYSLFAASNGFKFSF